MLSLKIAKFGGTSLANFVAMSRSADLLLSDMKSGLVILSAISGITDILIKLSHGNKHTRFNLINKVYYIHRSIIDKIVNNVFLQTKINNIMSDIINLSKMAEISISRSLTDSLIGYGEIMSSIIFNEILSEKGAKSLWFDIRRIMITNNNFNEAVPNTKLLSKLSNKYIKPFLSNNLVVTQGFIGSNLSGNTTTIGRDGSNYTATLLAEALSAKQVNIWTDVPGIYTVDPKIVKSSKIIENLSFKKALFMAAFGAKIISLTSIEPACRANIPIIVRSSIFPSDRKTIISSYKSIHKTFDLTALLLKKKQILFILKTNFRFKDLILNYFFKIMNKCDIKYYKPIIFTSCIFTLVIIDININNYKNLIEKQNSINVFFKKLRKNYKIKIKKDMSIVTLLADNVITNITEIFKIRKKLLKIFPDHKHNIYLDLNNYNLHIIIPDKISNILVKRLYTKIF